MRVAALALLLMTFQVHAECAYTSEELVEGKPIVSVSPVYPSRALRKGIEGCVVLGYALEAKANGPEGGLYPHKVIVLSASETESGAFVKAAKKALGKWLFIERTHDASSEAKYYSVFPFELVETDADD